MKPELFAGSLITPFHTPLPFLPEQREGERGLPFFLLYINVRLQSSKLRLVSAAPSGLPGDAWLNKMERGGCGVEGVSLMSLSTLNFMQDPCPWNWRKCIFFFLRSSQVHASVCVRGLGCYPAGHQFPPDVLWSAAISSRGQFIVLSLRAGIGER